MATSPVDLSDFTNNTPDLSQFTDASGGADVGGAGGTIGGSSLGTIDSGSSSGVSGIDLGGLINDVGSTVAKDFTAISGQPVQRLPNGQILLPNGQVVSQTPVFSTSSSSLLLLAAFGLIVLVLVMRK